MKKAFLIFLIFFYLYPVYPRFSPLPTDRIIQAAGFILIFLKVGGEYWSINRPIFKVIIITLGLSLFALLVQARTSGFDFYFLKYSLDGLFLLLSSYLIIYLGKNFFNEFNVVKLFDLIIYATLIQAVISFFFFLNPSLFRDFVSLLNPDVNQGLLVRVGYINKRLMGIGNSFFTGVINYGFSFLILTALPYFKYSRVSGNKYFYWGSVCLIGAAGLFTGRTFIVALGISFLMLTIIERKKLYRFSKNIFKALVIVGILAILFYQVLTIYIDAARLNIIFSFVFELFINFIQTGEIQSSSSSVLMDMYKFPDNPLTWIFGDGRMVDPSGGYYMHTDVGYLRLLFYFGIFGVLFYIFSQYYITRIIAKLDKNKIFKLLLFFMFFWIFILNFKGLASGNIYFSLILVCLVMTNEKTANVE